MSKHTVFPFAMPRASRLALALTALAVVLRVLSALYQGNSVTDLPGIYDQISYHELAQRVADGYGFSFGTDHWPATRAGEPTAHWSYLYTLYLAAVYTLFGAAPLTARLIQAVVVGILHTWLVWRMGGRLFGPRAGLAAAACSAVYIYFIYYAGGLLTESFYFVAILWTLDVSLRLVSDPTRAHRWTCWLELGLAVAVTLLLRQVFIVFLPVLFVWLWWNLPQAMGQGSVRRRAALRRPRVLAGPVLAGVVILVLIAPWTLRNYRAYGTVVPLNTNAGYAFFWGNHPVYGTKFVPILPADMYHDLIPAELLPLNEAELDRALLKLAAADIAADPVRYVQLSLSRMGEYVKFWPSPQSGLISNIARVGSFGLFLPFMLYGLWRSVFLLRAPLLDKRRAGILLLYLFMLVYAGVHIATWTLIRYRLPVDVVLLIFAGYGLATLAEHVYWRDEARCVSPQAGAA